MTDHQHAHDVIIIGGGPSGLAVARRLIEMGIKDVVVLDREREHGGIPRHCGHTGYGLRDFGALLTGPAYAKRTVRAAKGAVLRSGVTVVGLEPDGVVNVTTSGGPEKLHAKRIVIATGLRETPRATRLVTGTRPLGVTTTGALQQMIYLNHRRPFRNPVIIGTELVSFSALVTSRSAGIRAAAMIEARSRITAHHPAGLAARLAFRIPIHTDTRLIAIEGSTHVSAVRVETDEREHVIQCDGVIFTGCFRPEATLIKSSHLEYDIGIGAPIVDQYGRCSDSTYFACGNMLHPVEAAGHCYRAGLRLGTTVARDLVGQLPPVKTRVQVIADSEFSYVTPAALSFPVRAGHNFSFNLRAVNQISELMTLSLDGRKLWSKRLSTLPERHIAVPSAALIAMPAGKVHISINRN